MKLKESFDNCMAMLGFLSLLVIFFQLGGLCLPRIAVLRRAAEQGFMKGTALLGLAYFKGKGVRKDEAEGIRWLRSAAGQGDSDAQSFLESHGQ